MLTLARQSTCLSRPQLGVFYRHAVPMGTTAKEEMNKFWAKNNKLNRPMSPHITYIEKITVLKTCCSLCLSGISAFALLALVLPGNYPYYLDLIHSLSIGPALLGLAKLGIAFPVSYHTLNGIRHLFWDSGKGFTIPEVYRSGYVVIALSILTSIAAVAYM
uniref:Succinate dehydrogenase cytochrome b560 subunit, mitochondrial n=1 Tax=Hucho hucho TaxID=62062 RepID=A0A4W5KJ57_9TELE